MKCHICEAETDFHCEICKEPVCEDCCVVPTYKNQIDYVVCEVCQDVREVNFWKDREEDFKQEETERIKKEARKKARHENYWKPENVKKRHEAKEERIRLQAEQKKKQMEKTINIVKSMFRGMF